MGQPSHHEEHRWWAIWHVQSLIKHTVQHTHVQAKPSQVNQAMQGTPGPAHHQFHHSSHHPACHHQHRRHHHHRYVSLLSSDVPGAHLHPAHLLLVAVRSHPVSSKQQMQMLMMTHERRVAALTEAVTWEPSWSPCTSQQQQQRSTHPTQQQQQQKKKQGLTITQAFVDCAMPRTSAFASTCGQRAHAARHACAVRCACRHTLAVCTAAHTHTCHMEGPESSEPPAGNLFPVP